MLPIRQLAVARITRLQIRIHSTPGSPFLSANEDFWKGSPRPSRCSGAQGAKVYMRITTKRCLPLALMLSMSTEQQRPERRFYISRCDEDGIR